MDSERLRGRKGDGTIEIKTEMEERKVGVGNRKGEDSLQTCSCRSFKAHSDLQESSLFKKKKRNLVLQLIFRPFLSTGSHVQTA